MAIEKTLNTRIRLKYDSFANWSTKNPTLLSGEMAVAYLGDTHTTTTPDNGTHPILFKVGPGAFNTLPWASALAADVYAWAKNEHLALADLPDIPVVDTETGKFVTDVEWDEDNNQILIHRADVDWDDIQNKPALQPAGNYKTVQEAKNDTLTGAEVVESWAQDANGVISIEKRTLTPADIGAQPAGDYKTKQTAIGAQENDGTKTLKISQNENGEISVEQVDIAFPDIDTGVMSVAGKEAITVTGDKNVEVSLKLDNSGNVELSQSESGLKATVAIAEYSIAKDATAADGYAATYHLTKDGVNVGTAINIPKDMVVSSGTIVTNPESQPAGTYIKLVLANADSSELFIPVDSLIEYVTSGSEANDMVVITIDENHKVTASITDGTITKNKLDQSIQNSLNLADTAIQDGRLTEVISELEGRLTGGDLPVEKANEASKVTHALTVKETAGNTVYDGSAAKEIDLSKYLLIDELGEKIQDTNTTYDFEVTGNEDANPRAVTLKVTETELGETEGTVILEKELTYNKAWIDAKTNLVAEEGLYLDDGFESAGEIYPRKIGIADQGVTTEKIADGAVTTAKLADDVVTTAKIADHAVGAHQTKACQDYSGDDAEVWVFYCGTASDLV